MGYSYTASGVLVCDSCSSPGRARKVRCPVNYCPAPALCPDCKKKHADKLTLAAHATCVTASAEMKAREFKELALMAEGKPVRCSALGKPGGKVHVLFAKDAAHRECVGYLMDDATYEAIPLLVPATPEDYAKFGPLEPAPGDFF